MCPGTGTRVQATTDTAEHPRYVYVLALRAVDHLNHQRLDDAERDARLALEVMDRSGDVFIAQAWCALCTTLWWAGRAEDVQDADAFIESVRATSDDATLADALNVVAEFRYLLGDTERAVACAEEALLLAQRIGNPTLLTYSNMWIGGALRTTDPPRARAALEAALDHARATEGGSTMAIAPALTWLALMDAMTPQRAVLLRRGNRLGAEREGSESGTRSRGARVRARDFRSCPVAAFVG
jgi:hypothetical protein